jgi:hypothetical protein
LGCPEGILKNPLRVPYLVVWVNTQTQNLSPEKGQTQTQGTQGKTQTPDFTHDVQLIKKLVEGKIIRICYDGSRYHVWTDTGSKRWFMFYRFKISGNNVHIVDELEIGCLDQDILIEPADKPSTLRPRYINDARLIRKVVRGKIIRICTHSPQFLSEAHGSQYAVWTDTGSKRWFMFYIVEISNNKAKIVKKLHDGCSEDDILIEPMGD